MVTTSSTAVAAASAPTVKAPVPGKTITYDSPAFICHELNTPFKLETVEVEFDPEELQEQAIVEFVATGICHTDIVVTLGILPGITPCILGHEGLGKIRHLPKNYRGPLSPGDLVLCSFAPCSAFNRRNAADEDAANGHTNGHAHANGNGNGSAASSISADLCDNCTDGLPSFCQTWFPRNFLVEPTLANDHPLVDSGVQFRLKSTGQRIYADFFGQSSLSQIGAVQLGCIVKVPHDVSASAPAEHLAPLGCGIQTGMGTVLNYLLRPVPRTFEHLPLFEEITPRDGLAPDDIADLPQSKPSIAIFGSGAVGTGAIIAARLRGAQAIIAIDISPPRLELAKRAGATHTINSAGLSHAELVAAIRAASPGGKGVSASMEGTGAPGLLDPALQCLATRGRCAVIGAGPSGVTLTTTQDQIRDNGWTVGGCTIGATLPSVFLTYLMRLLQRGGPEWDILKEIVKAYPPEEMQLALEETKAGKVVKPVILWGGQDAQA